MKFHEFGDKNLPTILLIHGGGSSWWNYPVSYTHLR